MATWTFSPLSGVAQQVFIDNTSIAPRLIRVVIDSYDAGSLDESFRYNPRWRTFGHVSLCLNGFSVFWESWVNFADTTFIYVGETWDIYGDVGLNVPQTPDTDDYVVPVTLRWNFRPTVEATIRIQS